MSSDELELSAERFGISDFLEISIKEKLYYLSTASLNGVFGMDVHAFALKKGIIIPSLGELVDYINGSDEGLCNMRAKLKQYPFITSTSLQREDGGRWMDIVEVNNAQRIKKGFPSAPKRSAEYASWGYVNLIHPLHMGSEEKELAEKVFDRSYASISDALNRLSGQSEKLLYIAKSTIMFDEPLDNGVLALAKQDNALIIKEYKICNGNFCLV